MRHDNLILAVLAVVIGTVVGWAVAGILTLIDLIQSIGFGSGGDHRANIVWVLPAWQIIAVPCVGGLIIGLFLWLRPA